MSSSAPAVTATPAALPAVSEQAQPSGAQSTPAAGRRVSTSDIQLVQNLIERCLQLYMSQKEVVSTLHQQAKIEPGFTGLVWQKLEEQNPQFFQAYYTRLKLKDQIVLFNHLLDQQIRAVQQFQRQWLQPAMQGAGQRPGMPAVSGMPAMQQAGGMQGGTAGSLAPGNGAPPTESGADGAFSGSDMRPSLPTAHLSDLDNMQVAGLNTSTAAASPPLFTGDSGGVGGLMGHTISSHDNLAAMGTYAPMPSPLHNTPFAGVSAEANVGGADLAGIPRNFSMSDLHDLTALGDLSTPMSLGLSEAAPDGVMADDLLLDPPHLNSVAGMDIDLDPTTQAPAAVSGAAEESDPPPPSTH